MTRRERIEHILELWPHLHYTDNSGPNSGIEGGGPQLRLLSHPSVKELNRCLKALSTYAPTEHAHLKAFYTAEWRIARVAKKSDVPDAQQARAFHDSKRKQYAYRARVLPPWVNPLLKDRAISWIAWDGLKHDADGKPAPKPDGMPSVQVAFRGDVFIPDELLEAAA